LPLADPKGVKLAAISKKQGVGGRKILSTQKEDS